MKKKLPKIAWRLGQKLVNTKRRFFNWRGDGVHSPYAYNFIRQVIRNPHSYEAYRHLYNTQRAREQSHFYGDKTICDRKRLELLFRLALHQQAEQCYLHSPIEEAGESLAKTYIGATGYRTFATKMDDASLIVLEHCKDLSLEQIDLVLPNRMLVLNTRHAELRHKLKAWRARLKPTVVFRMVGLEVWIWRQHTTSGIYPVYL